MKLSTETLGILKNFGNINSGIYINPGKVIKTISPYKNILAEAKINEEFFYEFGIYDLNKFLSVISLHKSPPSFEFYPKYVQIISEDGRSKLDYRFCDKSTIVVPPDNDLEFPEPEIEFLLDEADFKWVMKTASVLSSPNISVESDGNDIYIKTLDSENDSSHTDSLEISNGNGKIYKMIFKTEALFKLLVGNYKVQISSQGISYFESCDIPLKYYVAVEGNSSYGG